MKMFAKRITLTLTMTGKGTLNLAPIRPFKVMTVAIKKLPKTCPVVCIRSAYQVAVPSTHNDSNGSAPIQSQPNHCRTH